MKHAQLHAIAHNFADSLASGLGLAVGYIQAQVYADAARNADFTGFTVLYEAGRLGKAYTVTITDARGRRSSIDYKGVPGKRIKRRDKTGRVVPNQTVI